MIFSANTDRWMGYLKISLELVINVLDYTIKTIPLIYLISISYIPQNRIDIDRWILVDKPRTGYQYTRLYYQNYPPYLSNLHILHTLI